MGENAEKYSRHVLRIHDEGHEAANRTYTHPSKTTIAH
ncbi:polysaccharide deacetylase family protein [Chryseomicrobium palamuruense]|uniref:Polysaccharide deacetylase family protein n=1 Tax=Chryseomicrobium palamuruense TaxID=682973 RepID=A0ABV8UVL1_9BACL